MNGTITANLCQVNEFRGLGGPAGPRHLRASSIEVHRALCARTVRPSSVPNPDNRTVIIYFMLYVPVEWRNNSPSSGNLAHGYCPVNPQSNVVRAEELSFGHR